MSPRKKKVVEQINPNDPIYIFRDIPPKTKDELDAYLRFYFDVYLAKVPIDEGNNSPLDFVFDIYSSMMGFKSNPTLEDYNFLGSAARGAQKSLSTAVIEALGLIFDRYRDYFHMASIYEQSKVTYEYVKKIMERPFLKDLITKTIMSETINKYGRRLKIGTGTVRAVNCFCGDQLIHTNQGYYQIKDLFRAEKIVNKTTIWNNLKTPSYLGYDDIAYVTYRGEALLRVIEMEDGSRIKVTDGHKCIIAKPITGQGFYEKVVLAKELRVGDIFVYGMDAKQKPDCNKEPLTEEQAFALGRKFGANRAIQAGLPKKALLASTEGMKAYLAGVFCKKGVIGFNKDGSLKEIEIFSSNRRKLQELQTLLLNFGTGSSFRKNRRGYALRLTWGGLEFFVMIKKYVTNDWPRYNAYHRALIYLMSHPDKLDRKVPKELVYTETDRPLIEYPQFKKVTFKRIKKITMGAIDEVYDLYAPITNTVSVWNCKIKNSFHGSVIQDEVDLTDKKVWIESKGMLSAQEGKSPLNVAISSRKYAFGNVQELLNKKQMDASLPVKIYKWGQLEVTQRCSDDRSGPFTEELYVNSDDLVALRKEEYETLTEDAKSKYVLYPAYQNCMQCGIFSFCMGKLKRQVTDNPHLQSIDDVRRNFFTDDVEFFKSQRLNRKPSTSGLVYGMVDPEIHFVSYETMFEKLTGDKYPITAEIDFNKMVSILNKYNCRAFVGVDFGYNTAAATLAYVDGKDKVYVIDELRLENKSDSEFALAVFNRWGHLGIQRVFPDVASPGGIKEFKKYFNVCDSSIEPYSTISKDVEWGVGIVRKLLRTPGTAKDTTIFIHNQCVETCAEIVVYRHKIDPESDSPTDRIHKKDDHFMDSLRYDIVGIFGIVIPRYAYVDYAEVRAAAKEAQSPDKLPPAKMMTIEELADFVGRYDFEDNSDEFIIENGEIRPKSAIDPKKICKFTIT